MNVGNTVVITPYDTPVDYQPDWRHCIATAMSDMLTVADLPEEDTDIIIKHMRFMKCNRPDGSNKKQPAEYKDHKIVFEWYADDGATNSIKHYLEALLLTDRSYKEIAADLSVKWQQVRLYEQLFYNIRDEDGNDTQAKILKLRFAGRENQTGNLARYTDWKKAAASLGYHVLLAAWGYHILDDDVQLQIQRLLVAGTRGLSAMRIVRGEINNFDINGLTKNYVDTLRLEHEKEQANQERNKLSGGSNSPLKSAWYMLLQDLGPRMVVPAATEAEMRLKQVGLRNKLQAQQNIDNVQLEDKGPQAIQEFSATVRKQLTEGTPP